MVHILLVEDDRDIVSALTEYLQKEHFRVTAVDGQKAALAEIDAHASGFDLVILDVSLADGNGFAVCSAVKENTKLPVIFLTASGDEYSVVTGLDMGADDYIAKPFRPRELIARINRVLRSSGSKHSVLEYKDIKVDVLKTHVTKKGEEIILSALEYRLLLLFMQNIGIVLSRSRILEELWDVAGDYVNDNTLTVYIKRLREKIEDDPSKPEYIETLRGLGYKLG